MIFCKKENCFKHRVRKIIELQYILIMIFIGGPRGSLPLYKQNIWLFCFNVFLFSKEKQKAMSIEVDT